MQTTRVLDESTVFFSKARQLPGKPSRHRVYLWSTRGITGPGRSPDGNERYTLEWAWVGGGRVTSVEAYIRFLSAVNGRDVSAILRETLVLFHDGRKVLPGRPSRCSLHHWSSRGRLNRTTGEVVTLDMVHLGAMPATSMEAYTRFIRRINGEKAA